LEGGSLKVMMVARPAGAGAKAATPEKQRATTASVNFIVKIIYLFIDLKLVDLKSFKKKRER